MTSSLQSPAEAQPLAPDPGEPPLDAQVAATRGDHAPWALAATVPVLAVAALAVLLPLAVLALDLPRRGNVLGLYTLVAEVILGVVILIAAQRVARHEPGWQRLGLTKPQRSDVGPTIAWSGIQFGVRIALSILLVVLVPWMRRHSGGNLTGISDLGPAGITMLMVGAVVVAPVVEEIAFRGLLLRALMRRMSFWPAALMSSLLFGLLHVPTVSRVQAIPAVIVTISVFGLLQCLLVRTTGRLVPAMGVHAISNFIATGLAVAIAAAN